MTPTEVREYLAGAKGAGAKTVWLFGGEPFLYFDLLMDSVESARKIGIEPYVTSNAFWAVSEESALSKLRLLREKGLYDIQFGVDPFHHGYVPIEHVRNAINAARSLDMPKGPFDLMNCYFVEKDGGDIRSRSREIISRLLPHEVFTGTIVFNGTAAEVLAERAPRRSWEEYRTCQMERSQFRGLTHANVYPYGHVDPGMCPGISIGNAREAKLSEIIATFEPKAHPIYETVYEQGPVGLARMAMEFGFEPTEYADACHLCYEARKVLLSHYPEHLGPAIYYERAK